MVGDDGLGYAMKSKNFPTKEVSDMRGIIRFIARKECAILENLSTTSNIESLSFVVRGKPRTKSILMYSHGT